MFDFSWVADGESCGNCYVEMIADNDHEEVTRSYSFNLDCDGTSSESSSDDQQDQTPPPSLPYYDEEENGEEEEESGSSIHQNASNNHEELTQETQEEPEEKEEPNEYPNGERKKLSLHNDHTKVAHISSHNDIDTVSDEPNMMMTQHSPSSLKQHAAIVNQQDKSKPHGLLSNTVENVKQTAQKLTGNKNGKSSSNEGGDAIEVTDGKLEAVKTPELDPHADMKTLMAADKSAIEQEKLWIKQANGKGPKNGSGPKKLILDNITNALGKSNTKHATAHKSSSKTTKTITTTTTTSHKSIPNTNNSQQNPPMMNSPPSSSTPSHQQQPPSSNLSHEDKKIIEENRKAIKEKEDEYRKKIEEAKEDASENPSESKKKIEEAQKEAQKDIQNLKLEQQERLAEQQEKEKGNNPNQSPSQYHSKQIKEAANKNHASHQKREAFRKVFYNRAKFAKAILQ